MGALAASVLVLGSYGVYKYSSGTTPELHGKVVNKMSLESDFDNQAF